LTPLASNKSRRTRIQTDDVVCFITCYPPETNGC